jgi:hypothetical protein
MPLGQPVDDLGHVLTELRGDLLQVDLRVLHGIVQEGRAHADGVQPELRHDRRDGDGMGDERLSRRPPLPLVGFRRQAVCLPDEDEVLFRAVFFEDGDDALHRLRRRGNHGPGRVVNEDDHGNGLLGSVRGCLTRGHGVGRRFRRAVVERLGARRRDHHSRAYRRRSVPD